MPRYRHPRTLGRDDPAQFAVDLGGDRVTLDADGRIVNFSRAQGETWPEIHQTVRDIAARYPGAVAVDASRDNKIVADLEADGVAIEPVTFSASRKRDLIENLIAAIEAEELSAPDIQALRTELEVFEADVTRGGNLRYDAPSGFHDDTVDSLALAVDVRTEARRRDVATTARMGGREDTPSDGGVEAAARRAGRERDSRGKW